MTTITLPRFDEEPASIDSGFGVLRSSAGNLPLKQLGYHVRVVGLATQTTVTQTYYNPFDECIEATYIFPLEGGQAVTDCEMWVADRMVRAKLKERAEARRDYNRAIRQGYRAALLEENRPETFSMKVGNIPPGEAVQIKLQMVGRLPVVRGEWTLRLPLVVAPRYTSGFPLPRNAVGPGISSDTGQVPDASAVTPPTWLPGFGSPVDLQISVDLELGDLVHAPDWPQRIHSSLHAVLLDLHSTPQPWAGRACRIRVCPGERVNRDFVLRGDIEQTHVGTSLMLESPGEASGRSTTQSGEPGASGNAEPLGTFALHIVPPRRNDRTPRDIVFLLDRSGSMSGWKMDAARRGISRLVDTLHGDDRFMIFAFDDAIESPTGRRPSKQGTWIQATDTNRYKAIRWLAEIDSRGGTEMGMAMQHGLQLFMNECNQRRVPEPASLSVRSRAMVLVTDGQITGEDSILRLLGTVAEDQRPRLFCLGIDRAVNGSVLQRIAGYTGGTFELVESEHRLTEVLQGFADEMGAPAITDLEIHAVDHEDVDLRMVPSRQNVLYSGRCRSIYGRARCDQPLRVRVRGKLASGAAWEQELVAEANPFSDRPVLLPVWGRARVRELEDSLAAGEAGELGEQRLRDEVLNCSLACNVLSRFTAFVAVDETERVNLRSDPHRMLQPAEHPEGWQHPRLRPLSPSDLIQIPGRAPRARVSEDVLPQRFTELMLQDGIVSPEQLAEAESHASQSGENLGEALVRMRYATSDEVGRVLAAAYQLPYVDLRHAEIRAETLELIPESVARENDVLPCFADDGALTIAMSNPADLETIDKLRFILDRDIRTVVAPGDAIRKAIDRYYGESTGESADSMLQEFTDTAIDCTETTDFMLLETACAFSSCELEPSDVDIDQDIYDEDLPSPPPLVSACRSSFESSPGVAGSAEPSEAPVVKFVDSMISEALAMGASHVILQAEDDSLAIVYVVGGDEKKREAAPRMFAAIITRLKIMAKVDVTIGNQPQSGRIELIIRDQPTSCIAHFAPLEGSTSILLDFTARSVEPVSAPGDELPEAVRVWWQRRNAGGTRLP